MDRLEETYMYGRRSGHTNYWFSGTGSSSIGLCEWLKSIDRGVRYLC